MPAARSTLADDLYCDDAILDPFPRYRAIRDCAPAVWLSTHELVSHLVGLPEEGRERMLAWAAATFDALGPANERAMAGVSTLVEMLTYAGAVDRARLRPDGWAALLFDAADAGIVEHATRATTSRSVTGCTAARAVIWRSSRWKRCCVLSSPA